MAMLEIKDLEVYYGVIQAIKGISFDVNEGEVIALIGANGAGKTTTLQTITGMLSAKKGSILFEGTDITKVPGHKIVSMGMAHVPEGRRVFAELSVYENLKLGAYTRKDKNEIEENDQMLAKLLAHNVVKANTIKRLGNLGVVDNKTLTKFLGQPEDWSKIVSVLNDQPVVDTNSTATENETKKEDYSNFLDNYTDNKPKDDFISNDDLPF